MSSTTTTTTSSKTSSTTTTSTSPTPLIPTTVTEGVPCPLINGISSNRSNVGFSYDPQPGITLAGCEKQCIAAGGTVLVLITPSSYPGCLCYSQYYDPAQIATQDYSADGLYNLYTIACPPKAKQAPFCNTVGYVKADPIVKTTLITTRGACAGLCAQNNNCGFYTLDPKISTCYQYAGTLKAGVTTGSSGLSYSEVGCVLPQKE